MKLIRLTRGQFAQVDDEDYEYLNKYNWQARPRIYKGKLYGYYACRVLPRIEGVQKHLPMHRDILNVTGRHNLVDHIDRDSLNNQRCNLRLASYTDNCRNRKAIENASKFKGVSYNHGNYKCIHQDGTVFKKNYPVWRAFIRVNGKSVILGRFPFTKEGEIEAAKKYDEAAKKYFKEFALLNFK